MFFIYGQYILQKVLLFFFKMGKKYWSNDNKWIDSQYFMKSGGLTLPVHFSLFPAFRTVQ